MRVIVCGSRNYGLLDLVRERVRQLPADALLIVGGARGPDLAAERVGHERGMVVALFLPDYKRHGSKRAPWIRNAEMFAELLKGPRNDDRLVIAFHDGKSRGTAGMISAARGSDGVELELWNVYGERD